MNIWDVLILLAVAGMVLLAVRAIRGGKSRCSCGCQDCEKRCAQCASKADRGGEGGHA